MVLQKRRRRSKWWCSEVAGIVAQKSSSRSVGLPRQPCTMAAVKRLLEPK